MEPLVAEFGWSYTQISIAASLRGLEMGIFAPIVGIFVDRFGPKIAIFIGVIVVGFGLILLSMTNSLFMFYGASLLLGLGAGGCTSVVVMTAVANWFNRKVSLALGMTACGFGSGGLLVPIVVWMIASLNWRVTLLTLGLTVWALCIPLSLVVRNKPETYGYLPDGEEIHVPSSDSEKQDIKFSIKVKNVPLTRPSKTVTSGTSTWPKPFV